MIQLGFILFEIFMNDDGQQDFFIEDSTFTFRVNGNLKEQFSKLCKRQRVTPSAALKIYMEDSLGRGYVNLNPESYRRR